MTTTSIFRYKHSLTGDIRYLPNIEVIVVKTVRGKRVEVTKPLSWCVDAIRAAYLESRQPGCEGLLAMLFDKLPEVIARRERVVFDEDKGAVESWPALS